MSCCAGGAEGAACRNKNLRNLNKNKKISRENRRDAGTRCSCPYKSKKSEK